MTPSQRFMLHAVWVLVGVILMVDVFQNCWLGVDCVRVQDGLFSAWLLSFLQWILYSAPAFFMFAWLCVTMFMAVKSKFDDRRI